MKPPVRLEHPSIALQKQADDLLKADRRGIWAEPKDREAPKPKCLNPGSDGMDARRKGLPVDVCPYEPGPQRTAWVVGWYLVERGEERRVRSKPTTRKIRKRHPKTPTRDYS